MIVAFHFPHNEGLVYGIFTKPGMDTKLSLVDLYEVDGSIQTFETVEEAQQWMGRDHGHGIPVITEMAPDILYDIPADEYGI